MRRAEEPDVQTFKMVQAWRSRRRGVALWRKRFSIGAEWRRPISRPTPASAGTITAASSLPPASGPGPVQQDPERPYVTNDEFRVSGRQPTEQLADLNNPILQPWARDVIRKRNELVLAGKPANPPHASCWPVGVPGFLLRPMTQAMYFIQTPKEVVMILSSKQEIRHIYLTDKHSAERQTVLVRRIDRPLRRRYAGRRHDRDRRPDVGGRFRNAAHESSCTWSSASA